MYFLYLIFAAQDLEDFVQGSGEHGLIVFTLGSMIGSFNDPQTTELIAGVFSRLPQRVIWRHTDVKPKNLGNNTMILDWMPQNDLLGNLNICFQVRIPTFKTCKK